MRTISKRDLAQLRVKGKKVTQLTETPKPQQKIDVPDHRPQLASLEQRVAENRARTEEVALEANGELTQQRKVLDHLAGDLHQLRNALENKQHPPEMTIKRGMQGFIDTVTVGGLVFKFKRTGYGSVEKIDILTR